MSKLRWAQFFWSDWRSDSALNLCSLPARGLWMELLCLAAQGDPYGTVTIKGHVPTPDELFNLVAPRGTRRREFDRWLSELETTGVAQRDPRGALHSPRMSHDGAVSYARRDAANARWITNKDAHANEGDLDMQTDPFASIDSSTIRTDSPLPPKGGKAGGPFRNGFGGSVKAERIDANPTNPPAAGAEVVPIARRLVGRKHLA
jgi:hypothetical protein